MCVLHLFQWCSMVSLQQKRCCYNVQKRLYHKKHMAALHFHQQAKPKVLACCCLGPWRTAVFKYVQVQSSASFLHSPGIPTLNHSIFKQLKWIFTSLLILILENPQCSGPRGLDFTTTPLGFHSIFWINHFLSFEDFPALTIPTPAFHLCMLSKIYGISVSRDEKLFSVAVPLCNLSWKRQVDFLHKKKTFQTSIKTSS